MQQKEAQEKKIQKKYTVKPPKDLRSKFELQMIARKLKEEEEEEKVRQEEEQKRQEVCIKKLNSHSLNPGLDSLGGKARQPSQSPHTQRPPLLICCINTIK